MARIVWIVRVLGRDGCWDRVFGHFSSQARALEAIDFFMPLAAPGADMEVVEVVRTIAF
jgi:hypothetical protein